GCPSGAGQTDPGPSPHELHVHASLLGSFNGFPQLLPQVLAIAGTRYVRVGRDRATSLLARCDLRVQPVAEVLRAIGVHAHGRGAHVKDVAIVERAVGGPTG